MTGKTLNVMTTPPPSQGDYVKREESLTYTPAVRGSRQDAKSYTAVVRALVTEHAPDRITVRLNMPAEERGARIAAVNKRLRAR